MPSRLRPTAPPAADAILVGDPGRALLLAQELLEQPKMSNHARGLWGYTGAGLEGRMLTIQSTGMGGPSAATVLADLAELGVRRMVRVGSCAAAGPRPATGALALVERAVAEGGSATALGVAVGEAVEPDPDLTAALRAGLGPADEATTAASFDLLPAAADLDGSRFAVADMQTVAVLARAATLGIAAAALLIVVEGEAGALAEDDEEAVARRAGRLATEALI